MLESHSVGNLGQIEVERDPQAAITLLRESIALKRNCRDRVGIAGSMQVLAQAHSELEDYDSAFRQYDEAETLAKELSLLHLEALILTNKAHTFLAAGKRSEALRVFKKAQRLANNEGFEELHVRATEGVARVHYASGRLAEAQTCMEDLLRSATEAGIFEFIMVAHHGLWASKTRLGDQDGALQHFHSLTRLARKEKATYWLIRGLVDSTRPIENGDFVAPDPKRFRELVQKEARRQDKAVTGALWIELARLYAPENINGAVDALRKCIACCEGEQEAVDELLTAHEVLYTLFWDFRREFDEAIRALDALAAVAKQHGNTEKELAAINQKGTCLQELSRGEEAVPLHTLVAHRALGKKLDWLAVDALHNLAECHRRLGETNDAMRVFQRARRVAAKSGDELSVVQIDHGYALALENTGKFDEALQLFKQCRDRARKVERSEYLRACEAIANLSWTCGKKKSAVKQYQRLLAECDDCDQVERKVRIAFNLSRLLRVLGADREAHKVLAEYIDLVDDPFELPDFHSTFAELCENTDRMNDARKHWQIAIEAATKVGNEDELVYCRSNYAEFERRHGDPIRSIRELDELLEKKLSAEDRGTALVQLFNALLQLKSETRAQEVFNTAQEHLQKHGPVARLIDLYMALFDHNWIGDRDSRFTSLQAYVAAFSAAVSDAESENSITKVIAHIGIKLTQRETAPSLPQLRWLAKRLEGWLDEQIGEAQFISMLMHPLIYAEKMIPLNNNPVKFLEMHDRLFAEFEDD